MRLLGYIFQNGLTIRQNRGQHQINGCPHGDHIKIDVLPLSSSALATKLAVGGFHLGTKCGKALDVLVNGSFPDGTAAG